MSRSALSSRPSQPNRPLRVALVANTSWYLYNFRRNLMRALTADGHAVVAIGGEGEHGRRLRAEGFQHREVPFTASGANPWREFATVRALRAVLSAEDLDVVLSYTPKGNVYTALALAGSDVARIPNVSGLGTAYSRSDPVAFVARTLTRYALNRAQFVFFQNEDDLHAFAAAGLVSPERISRLPGSGVDLTAFRPKSAAATDEGRQTPFVFLMMARLLWDKGVGEFVQAARLLRSERPGLRFRLLGAPATDHRDGVPESALRAWCNEGVIEYGGVAEDVRPELAGASCVVLPSVYREGVPRTLLEAAACALPIVTTDSVGCRDTVDDGISGLLCRPRDTQDLAVKLRRIVDMGEAARLAMGAAGRAKMEHEFDERLVIDAYRMRLTTIRMAAGCRGNN